MNKLYVSNLNYSIGEPELRLVFGDYGKLKEVKLIRKQDQNHLSRGYAFITFEDEESAQRAMEELNGAEYESRRMCISPAIDNRNK